MDLSLLAPGVPAGYANIASATTTDLALVYNSRSAWSAWLGRDIAIVLSSQNIFNSPPPRVINPAGGGGPGILFDPANGFPLGRAVQLRIGKAM